MRLRQAAWIVVALTGLLGLAQYAVGLHALAYDRTAIAAGQWWRCYTASWVHYTFAHLAMNVLALALIAGVLLADLPLRSWCLLLALLPWAVSLGLWYGQPQCQVYAGFSGVIEGLLFFALWRARRSDPILYGLALAFFAARLAYEHTPWYDPDYLHAWIGVAVAPSAHLAGAALGSLLALIGVGCDKLVTVR